MLETGIRRFRRGEDQNQFRACFETEFKEGRIRDVCQIFARLLAVPQGGCIAENGTENVNKTSQPLLGLALKFWLSFKPRFGTIPL